MKASNFAQKTLLNRISDAEYINELESRIIEMDERIEQFVEAMDKAVFSRDQILVLDSYVENLKLLRL